MRRIERGGVFWIDAATKVGWAYGMPTWDAPEWGVWQLPDGPDLGRKLVAFDNALCDAFDKYRPSLFGIEAPLPAGGQTNAHTARMLIGMAAVAEVCAYRWEVRYVERSSTTVRAAVIGRSRRSDEDKAAGLDVKDAIVAPWIKAQGWKISDHNARDAAVGWAYEIGMRAGAPRVTKAA